MSIDNFKMTVDPSQSIWSYGHWSSFVAASSDPQRPWWAAALDFDTFIEDSAILSSVLSFTTI